MPFEVTWVLADADSLARDLDGQLRRGRAFVPGSFAVQVLDAGTLVVSRADVDGGVAVPARAVMVLAEGAMQGVGLEVTIDAQIDGELGRLVTLPPGSRLRAEETPEAPADPPPRLSLDDLVLGTPVTPDPHAGAPLDAEAIDRDDESSEDRVAKAYAGDPRFLRLRGLGLAERAKVAREGFLEDRVMLERMYGRAVWEDLLRNPQLTPPEVARIAGKGTVPTIMLELIVDNAAWSRQSLVRNALLRNPRLAAEAQQKLLRGMNKNELRLITQGTAYPASVRGLAKKLLGL